MWTSIALTVLASHDCCFVTLSHFRVYVCVLLTDGQVKIHNDGNRMYVRDATILNFISRIEAERDDQWERRFRGGSTGSTRLPSRSSRDPCGRSFLSRRIELWESCTPGCRLIKLAVYIASLEYYVIAHRDNQVKFQSLKRREKRICTRPLDLVVQWYLYIYSCINGLLMRDYYTLDFQVDSKTENAIYCLIVLKKFQFSQVDIFSYMYIFSVLIRN